MRLIAVICLLLTSACTGQWGDWMQAGKPDEDQQFYCKYYDQCSKMNKGLYGGDVSLKESDSLYKPDTELYGKNTSEDLYGKSN